MKHLSEQKRRFNIKIGFSALNSLVSSNSKLVSTAAAPTVSCGMLKISHYKSLVNKCSWAKQSTQCWSTAVSRGRMEISGKFLTFPTPLRSLRHGQFRWSGKSLQNSLYRLAVFKNPGLFFSLSPVFCAWVYREKNSHFIFHCQITLSELKTYSGYTS